MALQKASSVISWRNAMGTTTDGLLGFYAVSMLPLFARTPRPSPSPLALFSVVGSPPSSWRGRGGWGGWSATVIGLCRPVLIHGEGTGRRAVCSSERLVGAAHQCRRALHFDPAGEAGCRRTPRRALTDFDQFSRFFSDLVARRARHWVNGAGPDLWGWVLAIGIGHCFGPRSGSILGWQAFQGGELLSGGGAVRLYAAALAVFVRSAG